MIKELPTLFSTPMVEAILEDRKTMIRRMVKPMKKQEQWFSKETLLKSPSAYMCEIKGRQYAQFRHPLAGKEVEGIKVAEDSPLTCIKSKYQKGDTLYVRESWVNLGHNNCQDGAEDRSTVVFKASENGRAWESNIEGWRWKPGIHLPKESSRIWLEVTDVRVERAKDISQEDAEKEGVAFNWSEGKQFKDYISDEFCFGDSRDSFQSLWKKINGEESWNANVWVWVYSFKILSKTGKPS